MSKEKTNRQAQQENLQGMWAVHKPPNSHKVVASHFNFP